MSELSLKYTISLSEPEISGNDMGKKQSESAPDDIVREALRFSVEEARITPYYAYFKKYSQNTQVFTSTSWRLIN